MTYRQEKTRKLGSLDCSTTEHSTLQQDDRTADTFMDSHNCTAKSEYTNTYDNIENNPVAVTGWHFNIVGGTIAP